MLIAGAGGCSHAGDWSNSDKRIYDMMVFLFLSKNISLAVGRAVESRYEQGEGVDLLLSFAVGISR